MKTKLTSLSILLIGNELVNGSIQDKNAKYLLEKLSTISGLKLTILTIPDDEALIIENIKKLTQSFQVVVTSGGLGPTTDDITISSISKAFSKELSINEGSKKRLEEKYLKRGRKLTENSYKQNLFPKDALILPNEIGTADSCIINTGNSHVACFPGVPKEFEFFINNLFWNWLESNFDLASKNHKEELKFFGLSEAYIGSKIESLNIIKEITIAYRPKFPEVLISLTSNSNLRERIVEAKEQILKTLGREFLIGTNSSSNLPKSLYQSLKENKIKLALAESCTGGRISSEITKIPGSSSVLQGGFVTYSNDMKISCLDIDPQLLETVGAVSEEVAKSMAESARKIAKADIAVSTTGIAGPGGATDKKPVGLVYIGLSDKSSTQCFKLELPWDRERNQIYAAWYAMELVRRSVLGYSLVLENK